MLKTYQYRVKDSHSRKVLNTLKKSVNFVWNFCNQTQRLSLRRKDFLGKFDFSNLTSGTSKELGLHSQTVQAICEEYANRVKQFRKPFLRWRGRRHLGWIPFKKSGIKIKDGIVIYCGTSFRIWKSRDIPQDVKCGNFSQDSLGRWYLNLVCEVEDIPSSGTEEVGIDLGLKDFATLSNGKKFSHPRWYRRVEERIKMFQGLKKLKETKKLHRKIKNQRKDFLHKLSTEIVRTCKTIFVGNVSSSKLVKTNIAKSILDAGWSIFKDFLEYKAIAKKVLFKEVNEMFTTSTCSSCFSRSGPKGREGLKVREWVCGSCYVVHDRDVNSAVNILRIGHDSLVSEGN